MSPLAAAERTWFAIDPDGNEHSVVLSVAAPVQQQEGEWGALVSMPPLFEKSKLVFGVDSWQATSLAMEFVATMVQHFAENGWQFFWERGGDLASSETLRSERMTK
jgi:hypothetical protein